MPSIHYVNRERPWLLKWRDIAGKQHSKCYATEDEARTAAGLMAAGVERSDAPTLWQCCQLWLTQVDATCRHKTLIHYKHIAKRLCDAIGREVRIDAITPAVIANYRDHLDLHPKTVNNHLRAARAMMSFAVQRGWIAANPVKSVKFPSYRSKIPRWLTNDEIGVLLAKLRTAPADIRLALLLAVRAGLRLGDLTALRWDDIREGFIHVNEGKSARPRMVPIHPDVAAELAATPRIGPHLFPNRWDHNRHRHTHQWGGKLRRWIKENGFAGGVHSLRHTFAVTLAQAGATAEDLRQILGHSSVQTSMIYLHSSTSRQQELVAKIGRQESPNQKSPARRIAKPRTMATSGAVVASLN